MRRTFTLRQRLATGALGLALVLGLPLLITVQSLERVHDVTLGLRNGEFAASLLLGRSREGVDNLRRADDALLFVHDGASRDRMAEEIRTMRAMADSLDGYALTAAATTVRLALDSLDVLTFEEYNKANAGEAPAAEVISSQWVRPRIRVIEEAVGTAEQALRARTRERVDEATDETAMAKQTAVGALAIAILLATLITIWLVRSISRPVYDLQAGMQAVAEGDFSYKLSIPSDRPDEFGRLSASYETMAARLAELDKLKAEFISVASHELKTPINVIMGYVELLQEGIYGKLNEAQREVCDTIVAQSNNLTRLVRRLLDVSRFEAGGGRLECRPFKLRRLLDTLESSFNGLAIQRNILFKVSRDDRLPDEVRWDEDRMNEVLGNLLSNAFKFTPRGGRIELAARRSGAESESVEIVVSDTGAGIPAEQLPHVFQKFFQADNQSKAAIKGTGLGLAIAKQIVEAHQGSIVVESQVGEGTTFRITLPSRVDPRRTGQFPVTSNDGAAHGAASHGVVARDTVPSDAA